MILKGVDIHGYRIRIIVIYVGICNILNVIVALTGLYVLCIMKNERAYELYKGGYTVENQDTALKIDVMRELERVCEERGIRFHINNYTYAKPLLYWPVLRSIIIYQNATIADINCLIGYLND